jgi:hypothetical protein
MNRRLRLSWILWAAAAVAFATASAQGIVYPNRWVFVVRSLGSDAHLDEIREIAQTAAARGLNGIVFSMGLDRLDRQPPAFFSRLEKVKEICAETGLEFIPQVFSAGYGGSILAYDRNLAEGLPVKDALFVVSGGEARLEPDPPVALANAGLEEFQGERALGYQLQDLPGEISFADREIVQEGAASLRFQDFTKHPAGNARLMQEIAVKPYRHYRVSLWARTEDVSPGPLRLQILDTRGNAMAPWTAPMPATSGWRKLTWGFNSLKNERVRVYVGVWAGRTGRFWVDDFQIEEVGLLNVLRREGTPLAVRGEESGTVYEEGRDFSPVTDPALNFRFDHDGPRLRLAAGSRIRNGERLRVSYYHGMSINDGQVSICMSEPRAYDIWREQARLLREHLRPRRFLLSMDEIRMGGTCDACRRRGLSMAEILGDAIRRQMEMIEEHNPEAETWIWSDMLDPNHNARANYYLVEGDYTGSWEYVPKHLNIMCWYYARRRESLKHFSDLGFRTMAGAYYDGDTLENPLGWLEALDQTPGAAGIMYTTWLNKYGLLAAFGDLVSRRDQ